MRSPLGWLLGSIALGTITRRMLLSEFPRQLSRDMYFASGMLQLPPHQYVIASGFSLKPSVYCELATKIENLRGADAVTCSGKTDAKIRVNKYDSFTANSHRVHLKRILVSDDRYKMYYGTVKPNQIMDTDGGLDWCCKFAGTQNNLIQLSRELDLDLTIVGHQPAGCSPEGRQERRMASFSQDLTGLVLIHNKFGNALNSNMKSSMRNKIQITCFTPQGSWLKFGRISQLMGTQ